MLDVVRLLGMRINGDKRRVAPYTAKGHGQDGTRSAAERPDLDHALPALVGPLGEGVKQAALVRVGPLDVIDQRLDIFVGQTGPGDVRGRQ